MKIKTLFYCTLIALLISASVKAQSRAQLRAGINFANISVNNDGDVDEAKQLTSFQVGVLGNVPLGTGLIVLQPGIVFTGKGSKTQSGNTSSNQYYKATSNPYYIEIPATLLVRLPIGGDSRFFAGAGPYLGIGVGGKNKVEGKFLGIAFSGENKIDFSNDDPTTTNYEEGAGYNVMKRFDYGLNGTAGIETKAIVLGLNYGLGLAKVQSGSNSTADNNNKHRVLSLTLGFKL